MTDDVFLVCHVCWCRYTLMNYIGFYPWLTDIFTYLVTPWSTVLLEKLTSLQLFNKFPALYGTRRFISTFTSARHLCLSWTSSVQSLPPPPTIWRSNWILSFHLDRNIYLPLLIFASMLLWYCCSWTREGKRSISYGSSKGTEISWQRCISFFLLVLQYHIDDVLPVFGCEMWLLGNGPAHWAF
jgi:hypothetical protein